MSADVKTNVSFGGSITKMYDEVLGPVYFEPYAIDTAGRVASLKPVTILETCCGTGRVTVNLKKKIPAARITGLDINPDMLSIAKEKLKESNIEFLLGDATELPFPDNAFDCVVTQFGMMFFRDKVKGVAEAFRVLKPGGTFIFNVWGKLEANRMSATGREIVTAYFNNNPPDMYFAPYEMHNIDDVVAIVKSGGFSDVQHEVLTKECIAVSADVMSAGLIEGNSIGNTIRENDPAAIELLKAKVFKTLVERFGDHPCKTTMQAIVYTATKK